MACKGGEEDSGAGSLPPDSGTSGSADEDDDGGWFPTDTAGGDSGYDSEPASWVHITQEGSWELSPVTGDYTDLVGELRITEWRNEDEVPSCTVAFALTGQATDQLCDTCDFAFDIEYYQTDEGGETEDGEPIGGRPACASPDLPVHEEVRRMGLAELEETVYFDYYGGGLWLPWFDATLSANQVSLTWAATYGVASEEEE